MPKLTLAIADLQSSAARFLIGVDSVPPFLMPIYRAAAVVYNVPWQVLAAINEVETDYGRNLSTSGAGAIGWMQFLPSSWTRFGVNADGGVKADPYDPIDAIFAAGRYLQAAGAQRNLGGAIFAYNHADWYVTSVELRAKLLRALPTGLVNAITGVMQSGFPVAGHLGPGATEAATPLHIRGQPGARISAPAGAAVVASADSRVIAIGVSPQLGRHVVLEDSFGNQFTYAWLGSLEAVYPVIAARPEPASSVLQLLGSPSSGPGPLPPASAFGDASTTPASGKPQPTAGARLPGMPHLSAVPQWAPYRLPRPRRLSTPLLKERLFAHPERPASYAAGGDVQLAPSRRAYAAAAGGQIAVPLTGKSDVLAEPLGLAGGFKLAPLRRWVVVAAGTLLGHVGHRGGIGFEVRPAGSPGPVDPRPFIAGWQILGALTAGHATWAGIGRSGAYGSLNPTVGQLLMAPTVKLARSVLTDSRVRIDSCDRRAIAAGRVDRRVLAVIEYLSFLRLAPWASGLACGHGTGSPPQLRISHIDGIAVAGHQQDGGIVDLAVRALLGLQGALRPSRIVSRRTDQWDLAAVAQTDHASQIEVDFAPAASAPVTALAGGLSGAEWQLLLGRLAGGKRIPVSPRSRGPARHRWPRRRHRHRLRVGGQRASDFTAAAAGSSSLPSVTIAAPNSPLRGISGRFRAYVQASGQTISQVEFQYSVPGTDQWHTFDTEQAPATGIEYDATLDTHGLANGPYEFRAVAGDGAGQQGVSPGLDRVVANDATFVALASTGTPVGGTLTLTARPEAGGLQPDTVTFQVCAAGRDCAANPAQWSTLATVGPLTDQLGSSTGKYVTTLDTTTLGDGAYDLAVTAQDAGGDAFQGDLVPGVMIDNSPPTASLNSPGTTLSGIVSLTASAQDAGSGVDAVKFEASPTGSDNWETIAVATQPPYRASFDTRQLADGSYDLRVEATDDAGNTATSPVVSGITVSNPGTPRFDNLSVTRYVAPATHMFLLGEVAGSAEHETWALGQTSAPAPTIDGSPLPYSAQGSGQEVLLRYMDSTGWEIADVLRDADGSAYQLIKGGSPLPYGQMTASGETWIVLQDSLGSQSKFAVFHRVPGGRFLLDPVATSTLQPLAGLGTPQIRLAQSAGGSAYGLLVPPPQFAPAQSVTAASPAGPVRATTKLEYAQLVGGSWTVVNNQLPAGYSVPAAGTTIELDAADVTGPGTGWAALDQHLGGQSSSLVLASFDQSGWHFVSRTGLDALDLTGEFSSSSSQGVGRAQPAVTPTGIRADSVGLWIAATLTGANSRLIARYDFKTGAIIDSWCANLPRTSFSCGQPLDVDHPAELPDAVFDTTDGVVADALSTTGDQIDVYSHGKWTAAPTPGFNDLGGAPGRSTFLDPGDGWLVGANSLARISTTPPASSLASWPQANRNPLLGIALPPGQSTTDTAGALTVGLNGTALHYDPSTGWQVDAIPTRAHHLQLKSVAFNGPSSAFAVGQDGIILHWDGSGWSEDPASASLTTATLNAVAFGSNGQGWAVGGFGTILHYDGTAWTHEQVDAADAAGDITSVTVAGNVPYAIAGGNLITRSADGTWSRVDPALLPSPAPPPRSLELVSGLNDGGLVVAGKSLLIERSSSTAALTYSAQSFQGIPVALAAFRGAGAELRAFVSVAPPVVSPGGSTDDVGGFPAGDGNLILQTGTGWEDLSHAQYPASVPNALGDGVVHTDPVLAVATSADGTHAWAAGGYAGTHAADGIGTDQILQARSPDWLTSSIWRYDAGGSAGSNSVSQSAPSSSASQGMVSFAFFSSPICKVQCAAVKDAQPDVNLKTAAAQIAAFAGQPGGPGFAVLGGNARGPMDVGSYNHGTGQLEMRRLPGLLASLGGVPLYAAYGPLDAVPTNNHPALPWAQAFAGAPAPFGSGSAPAGVTPRSSGDPTGPVNKYYAFDATQNGGTARIIVLDNSAGSLDKSAPGQTAWLANELSDAQVTGLPVVVIAARPLNSHDAGAASDGDAVAAQLAAAGNVFGVFTTSGGTTNAWSTQTDQVVEVPYLANPDPLNPVPQVPEYEGATLTYQQPQNNGVTWYDVSVDTVNKALSVQAIPVISSLALEPLNGLSAARSSTLQFQAIARRPPSTIATTPSDPNFPGFGQYVNIPASGCAGCIPPSYTFSSSDPTVGDFVVPTSPGSPYPKLNGKGKPSHSSTSGLFCAYNAGTTTVSVTVGLLTSSLPVTVQSGGFGPPCGTVAGGNEHTTIVVPGRVIKTAAGSPSTPPPVAPSSAPPTVLPKLALPPPAPAPPAPALKQPVLPVRIPPIPIAALPPAPPVFLPSPTVGVPPVVPPTVPPAVTPVPPGGATAQAAARREEKVRKHAQQSAFVTRPAGSDAEAWFYPVVGAVGLLALLLIAAGARPGPRSRPAFGWVREPDGRRPR